MSDQISTPCGGAAAHTVHPGLTFAEVRGFRPLLLDLHLPAPPPDGRPVPVVVWIHGGAFWEGDRRYLPGTLPAGSVFRALTDAGLAVATIDYRLSGEACFPAPLEDVRAALDFLRSKGEQWQLDTERIGVWGESAGGTLAALAALDATADGGRPVAAAALWYTPTDFTVLPHGDDPDDPLYRLLGGPSSELVEAARAASPVHQVTAAAPPFQIVHGTADAAVPAAQAERLHARLLAAGVEAEYVPVEGADHCFTGHPDPGELIARTVGFLAARLGAAEPRG
ncbi:alpha/beta hydrolase fold domain-containing protein [Kitasatospora sp. NPDC058965]|uniref:alpha/beta hydrolase fold domain-containing protein n=1 Tax=Kitasatospora sp. NPDC058965 TaxID=3346682 RepID=UPI0036CFC265